MYVCNMKLRIRTDNNFLTTQVEGQIPVETIMAKVFPILKEIPPTKKGVKAYKSTEDVKYVLQVPGGVINIMLYKGYIIIVE